MVIAVICRFFCRSKRRHTRDKCSLPALHICRKCVKVFFSIIHVWHLRQIQFDLSQHRFKVFLSVWLHFKLFQSRVHIRWFEVRSYCFPPPQVQRVSLGEHPSPEVVGSYSGKQFSEQEISNWRSSSWGILPDWKGELPHFRCRLSPGMSEWAQAGCCEHLRLQIWW